VIIAELRGVSAYLQTTKYLEKKCKLPIFWMRKRVGPKACY